MGDMLMSRMKRMGNQRALILNNEIFSYCDLVSGAEKIAKKMIHDSFTRNDLYVIASNKGVSSIEGLLAIIFLEGKCAVVDQPEEHPLFKREPNVPPTINEIPNESTGAWFLVKSSGSTGNSKWIWRSEVSWKRAYKLHRDIFKCEPGTTFWLDGSLTYTGNLHTLLATWWNGGCVYWTTNRSIRSAYTEVVNERLESWFLLPSKLETLSHYFLRKPDVVNQPKQIITVGEPLHETTYRRLKQRLSKTTIQMYYGSAELGHVSLKTVSESEWAYQHVGKPFKDVKIMIRDQKIYVSSPFTCFNDENYHTSGDLGVYKEGELYVLGREATQINRRGVKIHLDEILDQVLSNALVKGAAIRVKHIKEKTTYELLLLGSSNERLEKQIMSTIPENMRPSGVVYVEDLPHNESGKQQRIILERGF